MNSDSPLGKVIRTDFDLFVCIEAVARSEAVLSGRYATGQGAMSIRHGMGLLTPGCSFGEGSARQREADCRTNYQGRNRVLLALKATARNGSIPASVLTGQKT